MAKQAATLPPQAKPFTKDHLKKRTKPYDDVQVITDEDAVVGLTDARARLAAAEVDLAPNAGEIEGLQAEIERFQEAVNDSIRTIRVVSIGRKAYNELQELHPPTDEQNAEWRADQLTTMLAAGIEVEDASQQLSDAPYNPDSFSVALVAACNHNGLDEDDLQSMFDDWNLSEFKHLFGATVRVNSVSRAGYWGKASG